MRLSIRTWITFILLALPMGAINVYSTLLTGVYEGGSIIAVILCVVLLNKKDCNITVFNLGQTLVSGGGVTGFAAATVAAIYYAHAKEGRVWQPPLAELALLVLSISVMAVAVAAPMRRYIVHWYFPGAVACATILRKVTSDDPAERNRARSVMLGGGVLSSLLTVPTKIGWWSNLTLSAKLGLSLDPYLYGLGAMVGHRVGLSLLAGSLVKTLWLVPELEAAKANVATYVNWIAVGFMTVPAFTWMAFAWVFRTQRELPAGFDPTPPSAEDVLSVRQWFFLGGTFLAALGTAMITAERLTGARGSELALGVAMGIPLLFALGKVASETGFNPVRLMAVVLIVVFAALGEHGVPALLAMAICGGALAAIGVDLFYDLRTGYLVRANPRHQLVMQFVGVVPAALAGAFLVPVLVDVGVGPNKPFPAPGLVAWVAMAEGLSKGSLEQGVWIASAVATLLGVVLSFVETWGRTKRLAPSGLAFGLAMLLPFNMAAAICAGSVVRWLVGKWATRQGYANYDETANLAGTAIFAAAALIGIASTVLAIATQ